MAGEVLAERYRVDELLVKYAVEIKDAVAKKIDDFKAFARIQHVDLRNLDYVVYCELEKVLNERKGK
jgi:hypothetical protein